MKIRILASVSVASICLSLAGTAFAAEATFARTLKVTGTPTISIATGLGHVHVVTGSQSEVRIAAKVTSQHGWSFGGHGDDGDRVKEIAASPPIVQNGSAITIGPASGDESRYRNIGIDYDVTLPAASILKVSTGAGDIQVANVQSLVSAVTGSGDVELKDLGSVQHVVTGSGSIRADGIRGAAALETGSGDIELHQSAAGDVKVQTGSGSIRLHGVNGALRAGTGSGDLDIDGNPASDWKLTTGSGSIHLSVNPSAGYMLNASTSSGVVSVAAPIDRQDSVNKQRIVGTIHGGGPTLKASTGSGDITVR